MDNILNLFLENPEKEYHVREIARKLKKSPTTISKFLKRYQNAGLLLSEKKLNHLVFKTNTDNINFKFEKINYNIKKLSFSGLIEHLEKELNCPEAIGIFGSYARGEDGKNSDIDIFVICPSKKEIILKKYENILEKQIQILILTEKDIEQMKKKNPELLNSLINGQIITGNWRLFK